MSPHNRLKKIRQVLNLNQTLFGNSIDLEQGSYSAVERGIQRISGDTLIALEKVHNINPDYIKTGKEPMFKGEVEKTTKTNNMNEDKEMYWKNLAANQSETIKSLSASVDRLTKTISDLSLSKAS